MSEVELQRYGDCPFCGQDIDRLHLHLPCDDAPGAGEEVRA